MKILAVDTALAACTVAFGDAAGGCRARSRAMARGHAEALMAMIEEVLVEAGAAIRDIDRFAVTVGPGTFTGVRVGVAAVRGLALVSGRPAVGITTLAALAATAIDQGLLAGAPFLIAMDARRDEIYAQVFAGDGTPVGAPSVGPADAIVADLPPEISQVVGSGADIAAQAAHGQGRTLTVAGHTAVPEAAALLKAAGAPPERTVSPRPLYLRPPDAKPQPGAAVARR